MSAHSQQFVWSSLVAQEFAAAGMRVSIDHLAAPSAASSAASASSSASPSAEKKVDATTLWRKLYRDNRAMADLTRIRVCAIDSEGERPRGREMHAAAVFGASPPLVA